MAGIVGTLSDDTAVDSIFICHVICLAVCSGIHTDSHITSICTFQSKKQFYGIVSCFVCIYLILQIISAAGSITQFVDPSKFGEFSNCGTFCNTKICVGCRIGHTCHFTVSLNLSAGSCIGISAFCQIIKACFFIDFYFFGSCVSDIVTATYIVASDIHV